MADPASRNDLEGAAEGSPPPRWLFPLVAGIFFLSGAASLVYEVVWTRALVNFFGASLYAVATVLTSFMGGLALGAWALGRRADRVEKPLRLYGWLEIGVGATALLFPFALRLTEPIVGALYATGGDTHFHVFTLVRFILVFVLMLVPTTLMGACLPVLSKAYSAHARTFGQPVGRLYALHTSGACAGVFLSGFLLIEHLGVFQTLAVTALVNIAFGALAVVLGGRHFVARRAGSEPGTREPKPAPSPARRFVLATYVFSGLAALGLQVCWFRALIYSFDTLKATTYSFSGMLLVFLLGLAFGSALMERFVSRVRHLLTAYALLQLGVGLGAALSFFIITDLRIGITDIENEVLNWPLAVGNVLFRTAAAILLPTFLMGVGFPIATALVVRERAGLGGDVGRLYAANTVGAIFGSFLSGFVLIPLFGIGTCITVFTGMYLAIGVAGIALAAREELPGRAWLAPAAALASALLLARVWGLANQHPFQRIQGDETIVFYKEGPTATVSVVEDKAGERTIYVDDVGVAGTDRILQTDQKTLAHMPMALLGGEATRVLSVGFGAGGASWSYTQYPELAEIHTIEISPEVLSAARELTKASHGIVYEERVVERARAGGLERLPGARHPLSAYTHRAAPGFLTFDPRFRVLLDDARAYLHFTELKYDVIATDCTDLRYKSNANLYDLEYFTLCREAITDDGLVVVWMPLGGLSDRAFRMALRTFERVFPDMTVWFFPNEPTHYCLLIGGKGPLRIDYPRVARALAIPSIQEDIDLLSLQDPLKLISCFVADARSVRGYLGDGPINTENHPLIEFESPRFGYGPAPLAYNMRKLYRAQVPVRDVADNLPDATRDGARLDALQAAHAVLFEGHIAFRKHDFALAARHYIDADRLAPDDVSIKRLLDFRDLRAIVERNLGRLDSNVVWLAHSLGTVYLMQERYEDAVGVVARVVERLGAPTGDPATDSVGSALNRLMAEAYLRSGREAQARRFLDAARRYDPRVGTFEDFLSAERPR
ncbi:MAG: fused MFS/spermidine synthase [Candidatus Sumerlaeia bacterium]|nr:fused MFS/spermidine synthase [Candidatus Sumerlaeia bacterium]